MGFKIRKQRDGMMGSMDCYRVGKGACLERGSWSGK